MMDNRLIDGVAVKKRIIQAVHDYTATQQNMPRLVSIFVGDTPEADVYVRNQIRGAEQAGLPFEQLR